MNSPWRTESMVRLKRDWPIDSKRKTPCERVGSNYQNGHDNKVSVLKEHYNITFHNTLAKVQVPENDEKWRNLDKLCRIGIDIKMTVYGIVDMM